MKRREFIKSGLVASAAIPFIGFPNLSVLTKKSHEKKFYDLAAIKGGEPDLMFDRAIEAVGGIKRFVKKNAKVVIKPNIGWDAAPSRAANTNPALVKRIVEHCYQAGAGDVYVFDHTCDDWRRCYTNSGIEKAVKDSNAKLVPGNQERYYQEVKVPKGSRLKDAKVHELILECDTFINVPVLKHHGSASLTIGMKNLMGIVWDRRYWHRNDLHQCIADFTSFRIPDLTVVDAYNVMMKNGPKGTSEADVAVMKSQIISTDIVAADTAAAKLFGIDLNEVKYIGIAESMKLGTSDLSKLSISRIKV
ncbi:MAG: DUF362 domain-containing protein [Bacteroidetes bacterium]|nr:DUF362 domain-containing protein [Bacteroidota bacterium]MBU2507965.1 DUF362 domain-containing protein [Bacteroidota bacterium]